MVRIIWSISYLPKALLNQEKYIKYQDIQTIYNKITSMKNSLQSAVSFMDYVLVVTTFLVLNDKNISKICKRPG